MRFAPVPVAVPATTTSSDPGLSSSGGSAGLGEWWNTPLDQYRKPIAVDPAIHGIEPDEARTETQELGDSLQIVTQSFHWLALESAAGIEKLRSDLKAPDRRSVGETLLYAALQAALAGATAGVSQHLVAPIDDAVAQEALKTAIESSLGDALAAGAARLTNEDVVDAFIQSQAAAARRTYMRAQENWIRRGRHQVKDPVKAASLAAALSDDRLREAASLHYRAVRDAWLATIAKARFGTRPAYEVDVASGEPRKIGDGTDLSTEHRGEDRDVVPTAAGALLGMNHGVMTVRVALPEIAPIAPGSPMHGMLGRPTIISAYVNGVNDRIREGFLGHSLRDLSIPRQLLCEGAAEFTIGINELGRTFGRVHAPWLRRRATVGHPQHIGMDDYTLDEIGLSLLLAELVPTRFDEGTTD